MQVSAMARRIVEYYAMLQDEDKTMKHVTDSIYVILSSYTDIMKKVCIYF